MNKHTVNNPPHSPSNGEIELINIHPAGSDAADRTACCGVLGQVWFRRLALATLVLSAVTSTYAAAYFAGLARQADHRAADPDVRWAGLPIANATAAVTSEKFSMCTGPISDRTEGLFVLDHNSGLLQCSVIYPRVGRFMATYTVNVADALGMDAKGGGYIMATGTADFIANSNKPLAASVVYVLDTNTGNYACYGIPFNRVSLKSNQPQQGMLFLIGQGAANPIVNRDELR